MAVRVRREHRHHASGEVITDNIYGGVKQRLSDKASVVAPLTAPRREIRAGEPVVLTITPLENVALAPSPHPGFPGVKIDRYPETGLSFYLKAAPMATISIGGPGKFPLRDGRVDWIGQEQTCPPNCRQIKPFGARVELRARPDAGHLVAWGAPCQTASGDRCVFRVTGDQNVSPEFPRGYVLTITPDPSGVIRGPSWECPPVCRQEIAHGTEIVLKAAPSVKRYFGHWNGACAGQGDTCTLKMNANASVGVHFKLHFEDPRVKESCWARTELTDDCCKYGELEGSNCAKQGAACCKAHP